MAVKNVPSHQKTYLQSLIATEDAWRLEISDLGRTGLVLPMY